MDSIDLISHVFVLCSIKTQLLHENLSISCHPGHAIKHDCHDEAECFISLLVFTVPVHLCQQPACQREDLFLFYHIESFHDDMESERVNNGSDYCNTEQNTVLNAV